MSKQQQPVTHPSQTVPDRYVIPPGGHHTGKCHHCDGTGINLGTCVYCRGTGKYDCPCPRTS